MSSSASIILPELRELVGRGNIRRRSEVIGHVADLFSAGAAQFDDSHVELFDQLLLDLVADTEIVVRAQLAERLSGFPNAPRRIVGQLARDAEARVASPVLRQSTRLDDTTLVEIARSRGQEHLLALACRAALSEPVTDVIVRRGSREVLRQIVVNSGAKFSGYGFAGLVKRSGEDGLLAIAVGERPDISNAHLGSLLAAAPDLIRRRLLASASPERRAVIAGLIGEGPKTRDAPRNFVAAQRAVLELHLADRLNESAVAAFARERRYEDTVAALSAMTGVPLQVIDRLILGEKPDPIFIVCKAAGMEWPTARAIMLLRLGPSRTPSVSDLARAQVAFEQLPASTAHRVLQFWQARK